MTAQPKFNTTVTITKGSLIVGEWVEMEHILTNAKTGKHHRAVKVTGTYDGQRISDWDNVTPYHYFKGGAIGSTSQVNGLHGFPVSHLTFN